MTAADFAAAGITPDEIQAAFLWGFTSVCTFWGLGYVAGLAKKAIETL